MEIPQTSFFGWLGTSCTIIYKLPQIYKLYKSKTSKGLSITSYGVQTISYVPYIIHGIIINDLPTFAMGLFSLILNLLICFQICFYKKYYDTVLPITS
tara:strand:+ start:224 stop:517 length:294 start_codon:yes stop_codon:yes gene_type:complete